MKSSGLFYVVAVIVAALFITGLIPAPADAAKVIKLHHLNKDDPFDNATGAMATVFKSLVEAAPTAESRCRPSPTGNSARTTTSYPGEVRRHSVRHPFGGRVRFGLSDDGRHRRALCVSKHQRHLGISCEVCGALVGISLINRKTRTVHCNECGIEYLVTDLERLGLMAFRITTSYPVRVWDMRGNNK